MTNPPGVDHPWLHLTFDEQHGTIVPDSAGNGRDATLTGAARIVVDDTFGACLELAGGSATLTRMLPADFSITEGVTILLWVKHGTRNGHVATGNILTMGMFGAGLTSHRYGLNFEEEGAAETMSPDELQLSFFPALIGVDIASDRWVPVALRWRFTGRDGRILLELQGMKHERGIGDKPSNIASVADTGGPGYALLVGLESTLKSNSPWAIEDMKKYWAPGPACPVLGYTPSVDADRVQDAAWADVQDQLTARPIQDAYLAAEEQKPVWQNRRVAQARGFQGRVAQLRIYPRMLTDAQIAAIRKNDIPIAMMLRNETDEATLYIDARSGGQRMVLYVIHDVTKPYGLVDAATADDWHFCLEFPQGALNRPDAIALQTVGWRMLKTQTAQGDALKLFATSANPVLPGEIVLDGIAVVPVSGRRDISVRLRYQGLQLDGKPGVLRGAQREILRIVDRRGYRTLPLRAYFAGADRVVLGRTTDLKAHIINTHADFVRPDHSEKIVFSAGAYLVVSFDDLEGTDWALAQRADIANIVVRIAVGALSESSPSLTPEPAVTGRPHRWRFPLAGITLAPRQRIEILLSGVPAAGATGWSSAYFDLIDIAGYRSERFTCRIEKVAPKPVRVQPVWHPLQVNTAFWRFEDESRPEYFKDARGVIHLRGRCQLDAEKFDMPNGSADNLARASRETWAEFLKSGYFERSPAAMERIGDKYRRSRNGELVNGIQEPEFNRSRRTSPYHNREPSTWHFQEPIPSPFAMPAGCSPGKALCFSGCIRFFDDVTGHVTGIAVLTGNDFAIMLRGDARSYQGVKFAERDALLARSDDPAARERRQWRYASFDDSQPWFGLRMSAFAMGWWHVEVNLEGLSYVAEGL